MTIEPDAALLPCPFCGDNEPEIAVDLGWRFCACTSGSDCMIRGPNAETEGEAIAAWNRRAGQSHADAALLAALEAAYRRGYDEGAEDALEEGETPFKDTQNDGWRNYSAAIAAAKGADHAE